MRRVIRIPKGGLPPWRPVMDEDTVWHARARTVLYGALGIFFIYCIGSAFRGRLYLKMPVLGVFMLMGVPLIDLCVRPGKGKSFLLALGVYLLVGFFPNLGVVLFFFPVFLIFRSIYRVLRHKGDA